MKPRSTPSMLAPDFPPRTNAPAATIDQGYAIARDRYAEIGIDTEIALERLSRISISLHCWQGDDVGGFENLGQAIGGGLAVTGSYPGRARTLDELRDDLAQALALIPGRHRVNLHASYADTQGRRVARNELSPADFHSWIEWARQVGVKLDFNPTYFAHELAADGMTLSHPDAGVRRFWIEHGIVCRKIGVALGEALASPCVTNVWIPDGSKDLPIDRAGPRRRLAESLDAIFREPLDPAHHLDAVEAKLFGLGSESYVVGSHEFYLGYAITRNKLLCLDAGHFHPTEVISDKISAILQFLDRLLLHVSRGVRWDSDHVVIATDELLAIAQELVRGELLDRVHIGLDFFDASINRIAAWVIGGRAMMQALLRAMLEPTDQLRRFESAGDYTSRLATLDEVKSLPWGAVWDLFCQRHQVPPTGRWLDVVRRYEEDVLGDRG